jgi:hypothetical protein
MAAMEIPAAAERVAVLETRELPGTAFRIDWAFLAGSSVGTLEAARVEVRAVTAGTRAAIVGRRRAAPGG